MKPNFSIVYTFASNACYGYYLRILNDKVFAFIPYSGIGIFEFYTGWIFDKTN